MRWNILLLSGVAAQATQLIFDTSSTPEFDSLSSESSSIALDDTKITEEIKPWQCDIRSWVRAPDLQPSTTIPGETRLSANGSDCANIIKWEIGLRFKERAIIKIKNKDIDSFPVRPEYPRYNASEFPKNDYNDIYHVGGLITLGSRSEEYNIQMEAYNEAMKNQSLWDIYGSERIVFDIKHDLPLNSSYTEKIDEIQSFNVNVPNTNFPPIDHRHSSGNLVSSNDEHMLNSETLMEYYHSLTLKNGTILDIPAGRTGFLPVVEPDRITHTNPKQDAWPVEVNLSSPRLPLGSEDKVDRHDTPWANPYNSDGPECDQGNRATFRLDIRSDTTQITQGSNITLDITVTRTGNGSEYPAYLQMEMKTLRNITWAYNFLETEDQYNSIFSFSGSSSLSKGEIRRQNRLNRLRDFGTPIRMLKKLSMEELEEKRKREGITSSSWSSSDNRQRLNKGQARFDIEAEREEGLEKYEFTIEVPVPDDQFPSFKTTYETYQSVLNLQLMTMFTCEPKDVRGTSSKVEAEQDLTSERDDKWVEYKLPPKSDKKKLRNGRSLNHIGVLPLEITLSASERDPNSELVDYLDPSASVPAIFIPGDARTSSKEHRKVGQATEEIGEQLRKSRYSEGRFYGQRGNSGGRMMHAARLWENKLHNDSKQ
ncbi:uncharacterized protein I206_101633 [Kwoniella pini CBS 10737]|uniref:Uncharacterized protein n=1 Tax=Kwoniella pini CBS 10737 TaxID=1296096 RepID=A0A1B9HW47_9TREE|nr:uncharacterized protein I206_06397 [Kwoniella pini CBS 10737]OCF47496.1 hypothetical protein I206_06397 [Kwoniella pini CBS 10737]